MSDIHDRFIWTRYALIFLGVWLVIAPLTFAYDSAAIAISDPIAGLLLIIFGSFSLSGRHSWAPWCAAAVGAWLQLAPLIFWAPNGMLYLNDTLIGIAAIAFAILIPGAPGEHLHKGPTIPEGWNYNPSSYLQRFPVILLAVACWFLARYMAAYQLGYRDTVYDPVFGNGTLDVISSALSKSFPVSDAGLGAAAYTIEALLGLHGGKRRWHTMPWGVLFFGVLVVPVGFTSILLVMLQPIIVGHWCFWCLLTALFMLIMIALTVDEVVATLQYLSRVKKAKLPFWQVFWKGGEPLSDVHEVLEPQLNESLKRTLPAMVRGCGSCWNLIVCALLGLWLMASPTLFFERGIIADFDYIIGALVVATSVISLAEVTRVLRFFLMLLAIGLIISTLIFWNLPIDGLVSNLIVSGLLTLFCLRKGNIYNSYGSWDSYIR